MKQNLSFYEFVGIIVPSVILLYSANLISGFIYKEQIIDFGKLGETAVFMIISYGFGHIIQSLGNIFENILWYLLGGMPTKWLTHKNIFKKYIFEDALNDQIVKKVNRKFGENLNDYGKLTYNLLFQLGKTNRIDIFNGNYALFRGLSVTFLLITIACFYFINWPTTIIAIIVFLLSTARMIRFGKYYATEIYQTFYNMPE
jgi:hypothetical protein